MLSSSNLSPSKHVLHTNQDLLPSILDTEQRVSQLEQMSNSDDLMKLVGLEIRRFSQKQSKELPSHLAATGRGLRFNVFGILNPGRDGSLYSVKATIADRVVCFS